MQDKFMNIEQRAYRLLNTLDENGNANEDELIKLLNDWEAVKKYRDKVKNTQHSVILQSILTDIHSSQSIVNRPNCVQPISAPTIPTYQVTFDNNKTTDDGISEFKVGKIILTILASFMFILAAVVFAGTFWDLLNNYIKTAIIMIAGIGLTTIGVLMHRRTKIYAALALISGGIAIQYISAIVAYSGYEIIGPLTTVLLLILSGSASMLIYIKYKHLVSVVVTQLGIFISTMILIDSLKYLNGPGGELLCGIVIIALNIIPFILTKAIYNIIEQDKIFKYRIVTYTSCIIGIGTWIGYLYSRIPYTHFGSYIVFFEVKISFLIILAIIWMLSIYVNKVFAYLGKHIRNIADIIISWNISMITIKLIDILSTNNIDMIGLTVVIVIVILGIYGKLTVSNNQGFKTYTNSAIAYSLILVSISIAFSWTVISPVIISILIAAVALRFYRDDNVNTSEKIVSLLMIPITLFIIISEIAQDGIYQQIACIISTIIAIISVILIQYKSKLKDEYKIIMQCISDIVFLIILTGSIFSINEILGISVIIYLLAIRFTAYNKYGIGYNIPYTIYSLLCCFITMFGVYDNIVKFIVTLLTIVLAYSIVIDKNTNSILRPIYSLSTHPCLMMIAYLCGIEDMYQFGIVLVISSIISLAIGFKLNYKALRIISLITLIISVLIITLSTMVVSGSLGIVISLIFSGILILLISITYSSIEKSMYKVNDNNNQDMTLQ